MQVDRQGLLNATTVKVKDIWLDPGVSDGQVAQTIIPNNAAFQIEDLDTFDSNYDDISNAKAVLMANISNYGSDVISEVPHSETYLNDIENQSVHAMQDFKQTPVLDVTDDEIITPKELPKVSLVYKILKKLKLDLANFDKVVKIRTTPNARTEGEWGFEHTKAVFNNEITPFIKSLKDIFNMFDKDLLNEIMEVQTIFDEMEVVVQQYVLLTVMKSMSLYGESMNMERKRNESYDKCLNLDVELLKTQNAHNDLLKREAYIDYLKYTQEQDDILQGIVKQAKAKQSLDNVLDFACKHAQRIQELLVYVEIHALMRLTLMQKRLLSHQKSRITLANIVPPNKTTSNSVETQKPELKVYSRKPKNDKNIGSGKKAKTIESKNDNYLKPNHTWGSNAIDIPSFSSLVMTVLVVVAPRAVDLANSPVSTLIDQDAPSTNSNSQRSSSNVRKIHTLFKHLGRWTKDHPIANMIGDPSCSVSTRKMELYMMNRQHGRMILESVEHGPIVTFLNFRYLTVIQLPYLDIFIIHRGLPAKPDSPEAAPQSPIQTPPVPQDEDERQPMLICPHDPVYVPEPMYPEYIPLEDKHILSNKEQPLSPVVSPTAESPEYVAESNPKEDPEEYEDDETEDGPVDYPMDGGDDGDDDNGESSKDDADDEDEDEEDEEEEEHFVLADSAVVIPTDELVSPPKRTEPVIPPPFTDTATTRARITVQLQAAISLPSEAEVERLLAMPTLLPSPLASLSPPSAKERLARCIAPSVCPSPPLVPSPLLPSSRCPTQIQILRLASTQALIDAVTTAIPSPPLPPPLYIPSSVDRRDDIPKIEMPPCKRLCVSTLGSRYEIGESSTARPTEDREIDYGFVDPAETVPEIAPMTMGEVSTRVTELAELHEHDTHILYALLEDAQDNRTHLSQRVTMDSQRVNLLMEDMIAHQETILIVEEKAYAAREAWAHSIRLSQAVHSELQTRREQQTEISEFQETDRRRQAQMVETLRVIGDMRREMGDMQAKLLALREQPRRARQPGEDARVPDHQDAPRDADSHI
nr:hypothetical protein [Tanacetum cinerariifolium]